MQAQSDIKTSRVIKVGPDQVTISDTEVVLEVKHEMPDWEVRDLNPVPIYFEDKKYFLLEKRKAQPPYAIRYLLHPWPEGQSTSAKLFHTYDADAVKERDANRRSSNLDEVFHACLMPLYPLLGLLWSRTQQKLTRFGFVPHLISGVSVFTVFCLAFGQGVFAVVTVNATIRTGKIMVGGMIRALSSSDFIHLGPVNIPIGLIDGLMVIAFISDVAVRYSHYLRDDQWSGGFLEWLFRRRAQKTL